MRIDKLRALSIDGVPYPLLSAELTRRDGEIPSWGVRATPSDSFIVDWGKEGYELLLVTVDGETYSGAALLENDASHSGAEPATYWHRFGGAGPLVRADVSTPE